MRAQNCQVGERKIIMKDICFKVWEREDMPGLINCIEDFYDKGYPYRSYLDADYLEQSIQAGDLIVLCGKLGKEIISISAVDFTTHFQKSGFLLLRVVKQKYRGQGIGEEQQKVLLGQIKKQKRLLSLYADVITHNYISQKSLVKAGFVLCGLRLQLYDSHIMIPTLSFCEGARMSQAVLCKRTGGSRSVRVYCPKEHADIVQALYRRLGVSCCILDDEKKGKSSAGITQYIVQTETVHESTTILAEKIGADWSETLAGIMRGKTEKHTYLCYLNMKDNNALEAYRILEEKGYFFTGIKPLNANGEFMLLCHIGSNSIRAEAIQLYHDSGLLDYIRKGRKV